LGITTQASIRAFNWIPTVFGVLRPVLIATRLLPVGL
jgi:hypothetical protein